MQYQMEKTDIKQQQLEDRLMSISDDLKKNRNIRNFYFAFIIILIVLLLVGGLYFANSRIISSKKDTVNTSTDIKKLLFVNDSLQKELSKLRGGKIDRTVDPNDSIQLNNAGALDGFPNNHAYTNESLLDTIDQESKFKRQYCYVNRAFENNDVIFVDVDFVDFYTGKKAVRKAKEYGEAEYDIDKKGDTLYFLYNNYYIHNQNTKSVILELDDKARVSIDNINQISAGFPLKAFKKIITDKPVLILEMSNGIVYKITKQKFP